MSAEMKNFISIFLDFHFSQLITQPTKASPSANILDLILTTTLDQFSSIAFLPGLSEHSLLHFTSNAQRNISGKMTKQIRDYGKGNFQATNNELSIY